MDSVEALHLTPWAHHRSMRTTSRRARRFAAFQRVKGLQAHGEAGRRRLQQVPFCQCQKSGACADLKQSRGPRSNRG